MSDSQSNYPQQPVDAPSTGISILGFFFPVVGIILYLVWKDQMPLKAKSAGMGALAVVACALGTTAGFLIVSALIR